jgi:hypothetical protein
VVVRAIRAKHGNKGDAGPYECNCRVDRGAMRNFLIPGDSPIPPFERLKRNGPTETALRI